MTNRKTPATSGQLIRRDDIPVVPLMKVPRTLIADLRRLIDESRQTVAQKVSTALVWLYCKIVKRIREDILMQQPAEYGEQIVSAVSRQFSREYGSGWEVKSNKAKGEMESTS